MPKHKCLVWTGAIIADGDRKSWDPCAPMILDIFFGGGRNKVHHPDVIYTRAISPVVANRFMEQTELSLGHRSLSSSYVMNHFY